MNTINQSYQHRLCTRVLSDSFCEFLPIGKLIPNAEGCQKVLKLLNSIGSAIRFNKNMNNAVFLNSSLEIYPLITQYL
jgi:hypothetical protein